MTLRSRGGGTAYVFLWRILDNQRWLLHSEKSCNKKAYLINGPDDSSSPRTEIETARMSNPDRAIWLRATATIFLTRCQLEVRVNIKYGCYVYIESASVMQNATKKMKLNKLKNGRWQGSDFQIEIFYWRFFNVVPLLTINRLCVLVLDWQSCWYTEFGGLTAGNGSQQTERRSTDYFRKWKPHDFSRKSLSNPWFMTKPLSVRLCVKSRLCVKNSKARSFTLARSSVKVSKTWKTFILCA